MADRLNEEQRRHLMSRVRGQNTKPELQVRSAAHAMGLRFRLHRRDLPGKPDLVFPKWRIAIFVHGCFWHRHFGCHKASLPTTRSEFWATKLARNVERDAENTDRLKALGWSVGVIWECESRKPDQLRAHLTSIFTYEPAEPGCGPRSASPAR